jgi:peptidoglycan/xylan/chitin deacetylase (PgdA/CDA1 family)
MWVAPAYTPDLWLKYAIDSFEQLLAEGRNDRYVGRPRMMSLGLHLRIVGRPGRIGAFRRFLEHVSAAEGVWVTTRRDIAEHFVRQVPAPAA